MVSVTVCHRHGGRWTSLRTGDREWLWSRPDPRRLAVTPGDAFVDGGGVEECLPTVRGVPDHGDVWSRPWGPSGVATAEFTLRRSIRRAGAAIVARYELAAEPGYRFVWAAHALLEVSEEARLEAPAGTATRVDGCSGVRPWPGGGLDRLGPDDGTAVGAILECAQARVVDGADTLSFALSAPGQPASIALWRNLRGWPEDDPYRSIGVEPMLGRVFGLATAGPGEAAVVDASGVCRWTLTIT